MEIGNSHTAHFQIHAALKVFVRTDFLDDKGALAAVGLARAITYYVTYMLRKLLSYMMK